MIQMIGSGSDNQINVSATEYNAPWGRKNQTWNATETSRRQICAGNGRLARFGVQLGGTPGSGSYDFTLRINGVATALTVNIGASETEKIYTGPAVSVSAGDTITIQCVGNSAGNARKARWFFWFLGDDYRDMIYMGGHNNNYHVSSTEENESVAGEFWNSNFGSFPPSTSLDRWPIAGINRDLYVQSSVDPSPGSVAFSLVGDTTITATISSGSTTANNTTDTIDTEAGDDIKVTANPNASPTVGQLYWGHVYRPDDSYLVSWPAMSRTGLNMSPGNTRYNFMQGGSNTWNSNETNRLCGIDGCVMKVFYAKMSQSHPTLDLEVTVRKNQSDTNLSVSIPSGSTAASIVQSDKDAVHFSPFDTVSIKTVPTGFGAIAGTWTLRWGVGLYPVGSIPFHNSQMMMGIGV